jgi:hypothetical protein
MDGSMPKTNQSSNAPVPPESSFSSTQLSLFQTFLCNKEEARNKLSNTIELWDSIPKYSISQQAMNQMRTKEGLLPRLDKTFDYKGQSYKIRITAAITDTAEETDKAYYPSANEELVEDALRKIAAEQYNGFFDKPEFKSGVVFSLNMLRKELRSRGHARSYQEITRSLNILAGSNIEILLPDGKGFAQTSYLPFLAAVSRAKFAEDPSARWVAHFHPLVTQSIDKLSYRQFNYHLMMSYSSQLARWLHKRLSHNYVNASYIDRYHILFSTVRRDSGLLEYKRTSDAVRKLESALQELVDNKTLFSFTPEEERGARNKIIDIKYWLTPHADFVRDVKAANKRQQQGKATILEFSPKGVVGIGRN